MIENDATTQLSAIKTGKISAKELMQETLTQIENVNPKVNAIVALQDKAELLERAEHFGPGPLAGLPLAIKDLAETAGIRTTYGSPIFAKNVPKTDSPMVRRLKDAGAIIIGKTNAPEFGLGSHSYNPIYGVTKNPYDPTKSAGGSSGGAGAALATRMVALADGSDMMGSLRNPAGWNNVFGFRPSYGLVANSGPGDMFMAQVSTDGPMARSMRDLELLLTIQSAHDPLHPHSTGPFQTAPARKLRIGWLGNWGDAYPMENGIMPLCENAMKVLERQGHTVRQIHPPFSAAALWDAWVTLRSWSMATRYEGMLKTSRDLMKPELIWEIENGMRYTAQDIAKANKIRSDWFRTTANMDVDVLALPSAQTFPFDASLTWPSEITGHCMDTYHRWMEIVVPASLTGLPALCVPAGFGPAGTPIGLQLIGHRGTDADILNLGKDYEAATDWIAKSPVL